MNDLEFVIEAADRVEPKITLENMSSTIGTAQAWLRSNGFGKVQLDRWDHPDGTSIELGYAHGEVWYRGWNRVAGMDWPATKLKTASLHPHDMDPLRKLVEELRTGKI